MKKIIVALSMALIVCGFIGCKARMDANKPLDNDEPYDNTNRSVSKEHITITLLSVLEGAHELRVTTDRFEDVNGRLLSTGNCVNVRGEGIDSLAISVEVGGTYEEVGSIVNYLCTNRDQDKKNDCEKGSYNVVYQPDDSKTGSKKLALESTKRNNSEYCVELFNVYTITLKAELDEQKVVIWQDQKDAAEPKILQTKDSCVRISENSFFDFQVSLREGDKDKFLCTDCKEGNYEIDKFGQLPNPDSILFKESDYNRSKSCVWFKQPY